MCQALDEAATDRVGGECHHDRDRVACAHGGDDRRVAADHEHVDREALQFGRQVAEAIELAVGAAILHLKVTPRIEIAKADELRLLRPRRERPRYRRAAEQRDELAPFHSITSSAMASSVGGTVRPSIRAVRALMTNSNFED